MKFQQILLSPVNRGNYALTGFLLFGVKYFLDMMVAHFLLQIPWSPLSYLIWPAFEKINLWDMDPQTRQSGLVMMGTALPFIAVGTWMTFRRLRSAGLPLGLVALFFLPVINFAFIGVLCLAPEKKGDAGQEGQSPLLHPQTSQPFATTLGISILSVIATVGVVLFSAQFLGNYGFGLFLGAPFAQGFFAVLLYGWKRQRGFGECLGFGMSCALLTFCSLFLVGIEGAICLIMFLPIGTLLAFLGSCFGYMVQARPWLQGAYGAFLALYIPGLPLFIGMESILQEEPPVREVVSWIEIQQPPSVVWNHVVSFSEIPGDNREWMFRVGMAYPIRAEIRGEGPGAVRHCVFSTGPFVEPITVWDKPKRLAFDVKEQPCPMEEWSPYAIHPPHLDHYLVSKKGEFRLVDLGNGRTRLEGTTWYLNRMWPASYWGALSDEIIHRIHMRVLNHIRQEAEKEKNPG
ncbi:MAG: hypothetical protein EXR99_11750 [Gemmataceae bacterium]|nr:hypothetical protein [Gemmataceae bacterium]